MKDRPPAEETIGALFKQLVADARAFVTAEIALYRAKIAGRLAEARMLAVFGLSAVVLANAALVALLVGLIMTLSAIVGAGWATLIVVGCTLALAALLGWLALGHLRKATAPDA